MNVPSTTTTRPLAWDGRSGGHQLAWYANGGVDAEVQIGWHLRAPDDEAISIMFSTEQLTLEFFDVESLERLRDVAADAAQQLRAVFEANARADRTKDAAAHHAAAADPSLSLVSR
ncbi:MAG: hypothetical protein ACRDSR_00700 [Pseudonocardiaceae bacterium]